MKKQAQNTLAFTSKLIDEIGPRPAGSSQSRQSADRFAEAAKAFASNVTTKDFSFSPGAFLGWIRVLVLAYTLALVAMWLQIFWFAALLMLAAIALLVFQFFQYKEVLDPFYPKAVGRNVIASLEPEGELRGELMITGHHDSARIFNFLVHQPKLYALRINGGIGALVTLCLVNLLLTLAAWLAWPTSWFWLAAVAFTALLALVWQLWFFASKTHTPGAGDNLASSAAAFEFLKFCAQNKANGQGFKHLRITAASWDAEEAGLRGARAWRKERQLADNPPSTWNLNLECLYKVEDLFLMSSDINGSVQLSHPFAQRCARILGEITGNEISVQPIGFLAGGTDAGETAKAGVEASTLMGMPFTIDALASVYHTPKDTIDSVDEEAIAVTLELSHRLAKELDGELARE